MKNRTSLWVWLMLGLVFLALPFTAFLHAQPTAISDLVIQDNAGTNLSGIALMNGSSPVTSLTVGSGLSLTGSTLAATGSGSVANPTATIGLTAVNGSASSAIRSDGAPPLSQAITPTWTGQHTFTNATNVFGVAGTGNSVFQIHLIGPSGSLGGDYLQIDNNTTGTGRIGTGGQLSFGVTNSPASTDLMFVNQTATGKSWMINNGIGVFSTSPSGNQSWEPFIATATASLAGFNVGSVAGDPSTVNNGDLWYNSTAHALNARINGATVSLGSGGGGSGTVTSVTFTGDGILDSSTPSTAVTTSGTVTATAINQSANVVLAGPASGSAAAPSFRSIVPADLPLGSASAFGAVKVDGTTITASGGVISAVGGGSGTVTSFSAGTLSPLFTTSVATATSTPALSFSLSTAAAHTILGNATGSTAAPAYNTMSAALDDAIGSAQGDIMYRNASGWVALTPGTSGNVLTTAGSSANPSWQAPAAGTAGNPTAHVGTLAVNGSATTYMRSDGAPAIDQTMSPTMTGVWTFTTSGSQPGVVINSPGSNFGLKVVGASPAGTSDGLEILSGTNSSDFNLRFLNQPGSATYFEIRGDGDTEVGGTVAGTTGAQTINKPSGSVQFAASATSLVVTDSLCTATSKVFCMINTNDATAVLQSAVPASGSFTINMKTAPTGTTVVAFWVVN